MYIHFNISQSLASILEPPPQFNIACSWYSIRHATVPPDLFIIYTGKNNDSRFHGEPSTNSQFSQVDVQSRFVFIKQQNLAVALPEKLLELLVAFFSNFHSN